MIRERIEFNFWWFVLLAALAHMVLMFIYVNPQIKPLKPDQDRNRIRVSLKSLKPTSSKIIKPQALKQPPTPQWNPQPRPKSPVRTKLPPRIKSERPTDKVQRLRPKPEMQPVLLKAPLIEKAVPQVPSQTAALPQPEKMPGDEAPARQSEPGDEETASDYLAQVRELIARERRYPIMARRARREGKAQVRFHILNTGRMEGEPRLIASSGYSELDRAALDCVLRAAPFPPFPPELKSSSMSLTLVIEFHLKE